MAKRLDQLLANLGYGSRSQVKRMISDGLVTVNGAAVRDAAAKHDPATVRIEGEELDFPDGILIMLNKPEGFICTHDSGEGQVVYGLLPDRWAFRNPQVSTIGRLDKDATGLLLLTDQTELIHRWTSPKTKLEKTYEVQTDAEIPSELVEILGSGELMLKGEETPCHPAKLEILEPHKARLTIYEGRYHQVKRMFAANGIHVEKLHRSKFGKLQLGDLPPGEWRSVDREEV